MVSSSVVSESENSDEEIGIVKGREAEKQPSFGENDISHLLSGTACDGPLKSAT